jgi:serine/threonine-protein kinase
MQLDDGEEALAAGTRLGGRFEIVRLIGSGGMGAVYEAMHTDLKKRVAIKTLYASVGRNPEARSRFLREGEVASRIRHPHVVDVTDVGTDGGRAFLVMEYLDGEDLGALIEREAPLAVDRTVDLLLPAVAAVAAGHAAGVIHRDLKPQNIFLSRGFRGELVPKVLDFGVSKLVTGGTGGVALTRTAAVFGTPTYMSPEQALGAKHVDARCDQYAMALIFYEAVTGRRAHDGDNALAILRSIGDGTFDPPRRHRPDLSEAFEKLLLKALSLSPGQRYPTLNAFGAALLAFATPRGRMLWAETFAFDPASEPGLHGPTMKLAAADPRPPSTTMPVVPTAPAAEELEEEPPPARSHRRVVLAALGGAAALGAVALLLMTGKRAPAPVAKPAASPPAPPRPAPPPQPTDYAAAIQVDPPEAALELDGKPVGRGSWSGRLPIDGAQHTLRATAEGYQTRTVQFRDEPPPPSISLEKLAPHPTPPPRRKPRPRPADDDVLLNRR